MKLQDICISLYSFGFSAGFVSSGVAPNLVNIDTLIGVCQAFGLGGVELPVDRLFPDCKDSDIERLVDKFRLHGLTVKFDLESFEPDYLEKLVPILRKVDISFVRCKIFNFYGGNRYLYPEFDVQFNAFCELVSEVVPHLKNFGVQLLVENHQDITFREYEKLWERFGPEHIGINWDIGNSLPALETPEDFLRLGKDRIGNIHLKDYKVFQCPEGYLMARCALGEGFVDYESVFKVLLMQPCAIPMSIELGALNGRVAHINSPDYWRAFGLHQSDQRVQRFVSYIAAITERQTNWKTPWEEKREPAAILRYEFQEVFRSIKFLKGMFDRVAQSN